MSLKHLPVTLLPILPAVIVAMLFIFYVPAGGEFFPSRGDMIIGVLLGVLLGGSFFPGVLTGLGRFGKRRP